ncbi:MAG: glycosyltransferase [Burkholderiales bacterium]|nr:MAG: glycosyltransferase [Burkholderiales bacterium]
MNGRVIVFARVPRSGEVKTRLARVIGDVAALAHYRTMLRDTLAVVREAQVQAPALEAELCVTGDDADGECARLAAMHGFTLAAQAGASPGERIDAALGRGLREGRLPVLIGSDVVSLAARDLHAAFDALREHDAVFAPTEDGGYALVGLRRQVERLFDDMPWGTDALMAVTRRRLDECGARWSQLRTLWDVDEEPDLRRWLDTMAARHSAGDHGV